MPPSSKLKPILVTGSHRSGTTWVGRVLSSADGIYYANEPFNPFLYKDEVDLWFKYIPENDEDDFLGYIHSSLFPKTTLREVFKGKRNPMRWNSRLMNWGKHQMGIYPRPLMKDPIAVFSVLWLFRRFNMDVLVMIRHPAAFVASIKKFEWQHHFDHFLCQKGFFDDEMKPFFKEVKEYAKHKKSIIEQATLIWRMIYRKVHAYKLSHPEFLYIRHEDMLSHPEASFSDIARRLSISDVDSCIHACRSCNRVAGEKDAMRADDIRRDSHAISRSWKTGLSESERNYVYKHSRDVWSLFYEESDWH